VNEKDKQLINAYLDSELTDTEKQAVEQRLSTDEVFDRQFNELREVNRLVQKSATAIDNEPLSSGLAELLGLDTTDAAQDNSEPSQDKSGNATDDRSLNNKLVNQDNVVSLSTLKTKAHWTRGLSIAASVSALAIALSLLHFTGKEKSDPQRLAGDVENALETKLSGNATPLASENGASLDIILTFQHTDGRWCREYFFTQAEQNLHGIACKADGSWQRILEDSIDNNNNQSSYQPATSNDTERISQFVDEYALTDPIDRSQEQMLIERAWNTTDSLR